MQELRSPLALVFDLDGTLVDSRGDIVAACNHALVAMGRAALADDAIVAFVGDGTRMLLARALGLPAGASEVDAALRIFHPYYAAHAAVYTRWMPGVLEALAALDGIPLTIATNKPRAATRALLEALGKASLFRAVVTGDDGPLKPDPAAIRAALAPTGVSPADAWVVGDGTQDIEAGRAAGAITIAVLGGFMAEERLRSARPDRVIGSMRELTPLVFTERVQARSAGPRSP